MGLFDKFKKKEEPKQNSPNSVFTLRFTVPYFQVYDKTNPKLRAFPVKLACSGSVQYRIADPTLCFDNVPLGSMSAGQLEEHVRDSLISSVKHFINSIDYLPILQFESEIMRINDAAKQYLIPQFADEYGVNLRTFNLSSLRYDEEDPNFRQLYAQSSAINERLAEHELEDIDLDHERDKRHRDYREEDELYELEHRRRVRALADDEDLIERENALRLRRQEGEFALRRSNEREKHDRDIREEDERYELERRRRVRALADDEEMIERENAMRLRRQEGELSLRRNNERLDREMGSEDIDLERKRRELDEEMYARRRATDMGTKMADSLSKRPMPGLNQHTKTSSGPDKHPKDDSLDLGSL